MDSASGSELSGIRRAAAQSAPREYLGCDAVPMTLAEFDEGDGRRVECWDARTQTAMVLREPSVQHDACASRLVQLIRSIAHVRGSAIFSAGSADLVARSAAGQRELVLQADATIYLHPKRDAPAGPYIEVDSDSLPDVVLEVDYTTDVRRGRGGRRGKLEDYAAWRLPEVWVEVPDPPWLRGRRRSGLTIFLWEGDRYVAAPTSRAFPGWTAVEIHHALNEQEESAETVSVLRRVGRALGAAEGTGPDDDPFLRQERREAAAELVRAAVTEAFVSRGIPVSVALKRWLAGCDGSSDPAGVIRLAFTCRDAGEFLRRVDEMEPI